ncbi:MAG: type IV pilus secretin PilQ [Pseudomonadota bacterium]
MPFFQMKKIIRFVRIVPFLLALFIISGCVAQKPEPVKPAEQGSVQDPGQKQVTPDMDAAKKDRQITAVKMNQVQGSIDILIQGNQKLVYTSIKQSFPFGIAVYLPETTIVDGFEVPMNQINSIGDIIVTYADLEKTTAKVEILLKEDLNYEMLEADSALIVKLSDGTQKNRMPDQMPDQEAGQKDINSEIVNMPTQKMAESEKPRQKVVVPSKTATMTDIAFNTMEDGKSDIIVQTSQPVNYDIIQGSNNKLYLNLYNTIIPDHHKRPILTYYFKSAVESLMPVQMPGKNKTAKIEINTRDQVPYRVVQDQNTLSLFFEASQIEPPVFTKSKKKVASGTEVANADVQMETQPKESLEKIIKTESEKNLTLEEQIYGKEKVYTGEKIKLDFYETDIKNVFRILRSVGGLNFAIDKNVQGKVTLTLENPVPWDQVMDLILKMNNLGQKKEGNVIRIATLDTLNQEEKLKQDTIAARKKTLEQKKSFEPLVTEYIPINYSDAESDIKPHLSQILTKDRGTLSVDKRTNMIIITDTQANVDQAKEIIFRLDKVTPQIMIEAKVVEVTKDFTRSLGVGLSLDDKTGVATSGIKDFTTAFNLPSGTTSGSFNFFRLFGSSVAALNVQLAASETKGDVKVISSPRILTLDNKAAKIKQGREVGYIERDDSGASTTKFKSVDLLLEVTPHVTPDKRISMQVFVTKNEIGATVNGVPSIVTNEATTELLVNNNDTIVIGGIVKTTEDKSSTGTPFLSGIPILGRLFRTDTDRDDRNEMLIFITPSIVQLDQKRNTVSTKE